MLFETAITKSERLNFSQKSTVIFDENREFSLTPQNSGNNNYIFQLHDFKGEFDVNKIYCTNGIDIPYDKENKTFITVSTNSGHDFQFTIVANIEYKKVGYVYVPYQLNFPFTRARLLKLYEFYEENFTLPDYPNLKFKYYVKKRRNCYVEVSIEQPLKVDIYDLNKSATVKIQNFKHETSDSSDIKLNLAFVFDPTDFAEIDNRPSDSIPPSNCSNAFYEIMSNTNFADVIIFSSSKKEIPTYRCVLAKYSTYFAKSFKDCKELPVQFDLKDYDTETIKAALDFCYGKTDSIIGKEAKLFEFASKYFFTELKKACSYHFEKNVNPTNVCDIIEIAYSNNFESLKQKCHKILSEHKEKIDPTELKKLSKEKSLQN